MNKNKQIVFALHVVGRYELSHRQLEHFDAIKKAFRKEFGKPFYIDKSNVVRGRYYFDDGYIHFGDTFTYHKIDDFLCGVMSGEEIQKEINNEVLAMLASLNIK